MSAITDDLLMSLRRPTDRAGGRKWIRNAMAK